eukprot:5635441-Pleurochrysis_carterae.AAC.1
MARRVRELTKRRSVRVEQQQQRRHHHDGASAVQAARARVTHNKRGGGEVKGRWVDGWAGRDGGERDTAQLGCLRVRVRVYALVSACVCVCVCV